LSVAADEQAGAPAFSPRAVLALVLVGVVALAGLAVLGAYAPDLRNGNDGRAHALSKSAIGYAGAPILMKAMGAPVLVSRSRPSRPSEAVVILTPDAGLSPEELQAYPKGARTLIVLPKWNAAPDPLRPTFVRKVGLIETDEAELTALLASYAKTSRLSHERGVTRPRLRNVESALDGPDGLLLGEIDQLQTLTGEGWVAALADAKGRAVLAYSAKTPSIWVLADPDLLNNQGLASRDTSRAATIILESARGAERSLLFDVTLNGFERGQGLGRLMLEPPWLAATLIVVAAGLLTGLHALARFGQPRRTARALALGSAALVGNSADLIRLARKAPEFAPAYADLMKRLVARASGQTGDEGLEERSRRRGAASPQDLAAEAEQATNRDELVAIAGKLHDWRGDMIRERR
jgi:hypothetical protein